MKKIQQKLWRYIEKLLAIRVEKHQKLSKNLEKICEKGENSSRKLSISLMKKWVESGIIDQ